MSVKAFERRLTRGQIGETAVARWLRRNGKTVIPVYGDALDTGKGPQLFLPDDQSLIAPDMLVYWDTKVVWIESKRRAAFTWHRNTKCWTTGTNFRHYLDYCKVDDHSPWPVWLFFLQEGGQDRGSPYEDSPSGLYGNKLSILRNSEHHRSDRWGMSGMVYWSIDSLLKLAELKDVLGLPWDADSA
jgi:hypothetical protein